MAVGEERKSVTESEVTRILARYAASGDHSPHGRYNFTATNEVVETARAGSPDSARRNTSLKQVEAEIILRTIEATGGNKAEAARRLGINKTTLWRRQKQLGAES